MRQFQVNVHHLAAVLALLALGANAFQQQQQATKETAPEPYSFSYTAESNGGFSSHQESGDGTGRVSGFYTIQGDDGRERRVDYVADENGYRATVKTNEVGTRSEPSADAQYETQLPSNQQLEAAKITSEQYKYLEDFHSDARARHLQTIPRQQQFSSGNNGYLANGQSQQPNYNPFQQAGGYLPTVASSGEFYSTGSSSNSSNSRTLRETADGQYFNQRPSPLENNQLYNSSQGGQLNVQQENIARYQQQKPLITGKSWSNSKVETVINRPKNFLQQQLEQQFMAQANQLTQQDYPRQSDGQQQQQSFINSSRQQQIETGNAKFGQSGALTREPFWLGSVIGQADGGNQVLNQQQPVTNVISNDRPQIDYSQQQVSQQQSNIINEPEYSIAGEDQQSEEGPVQVAVQPERQQIVTMNTKTRSWSSYSNQTAPQFNQVNLSEEQNKRAQGQIQLGVVQDTYSNQQQQNFIGQQQLRELQQFRDQQQQQRESNQAKLVTTQQQQNFAKGQVQAPFGEDQRNINQQVIISGKQQEQILRRPDSIQQIIEGFTKQPVVTTTFKQFEDSQNQEKQQEITTVGAGGYTKQIEQVNFRPTVIVNRPETTFTVTPTIRPEIIVPILFDNATTPQQPTTFYQPTTTTTITTTTTTTETPVPETTRPQIISEAPVIIKTSQQPQQQVFGVKGKSKFSSPYSWSRQQTQITGGSIVGGERRVVTLAPQYHVVQQQQQNRWSVTSAPTRRPTQAIIVETTTEPETSQEPVTNRPIIKVNVPRVDYVSSTRRPEQLISGLSLNQVKQQQQQLRQQVNDVGVTNSLKVVGQTKGGSKVSNKRQFWFNNGQQVGYSNQGSYVPTNGGGYTSFGGRISSLRTSSNNKRA